MFFRIQVFQGPGFSRFFQVFQGPGFLGSKFFKVQVFPSPGFSGSKSFRVRVHGPGSGLEVAKNNHVTWQNHSVIAKFKIIKGLNG